MKLISKTSYRYSQKPKGSQPQTSRSCNILGKSRTSTALSSKSGTKNHIKDLSKKLQQISSSVEVNIEKNRLKLIEYEMEGERNRHDSQMIHAKLRNLENRAEMHRADLEIMILAERKSNPNNQMIKRRRRSLITQPKPYQKTYREFVQEMDEKQQKAAFDDQEEDLLNAQLKDISKSRNGFKYWDMLQKHPKILNYTSTKMKEASGELQRNDRESKIIGMSQQLKKQSPKEQYTEAIDAEKSKDMFRHIEDPEKIIERQITKFYLRKNPGKLSSAAHSNKRAKSLLERQSQILYEIDDHKISKEDRKSLRFKFNEMANQIVKSDRQNSRQKHSQLPSLPSKQNLHQRQSIESINSNSKVSRHRYDQEQS